MRNKTLHLPRRPRVKAVDPDAGEDARLLRQGKPDTADAVPDEALDVRLLKQALAASVLRKRGP